MTEELHRRTVHPQPKPKNPSKPMHTKRTRLTAGSRCSSNDAPPATALSKQQTPFFLVNDSNLRLSFVTLTALDVFRFHSARAFPFTHDNPYETGSPVTVHNKCMMYVASLSIYRHVRLDSALATYGESISGSRPRFLGCFGSRCRSSR